MGKQNGSPLYGEEFKNIIFKRANELISQGLTEGVLDEKTGGLMVYINNKPLLCLYSAKIEQGSPELIGKMIYVGAAP